MYRLLPFVLLFGVCMPQAQENSLQSTDTLIQSDIRKGEDSSNTLRLTDATVLGHQPYTAAGSQVFRDRDFNNRVMLKPSDLIKVTPGLFTGQHAGGGKANQYFLRGFDVDHGTDLALWVDNMPVNMVSHAHGQGYADLHFIIPELFQKVEVQKGPYSAEYGDFATAGAVRMVSQPTFTKSFVQLQGGMFNDYRFVGLWSVNDSLYWPTLAAEIARNDGPFDQPEDLERYNLFARSKLWQGQASQLDMTFMAYGSGWNGSGQVPERAVKSGALSRWGSVDPSEGGNSSRNSFSMRWSGSQAQNEWNLSAYVLQYRLNLYSNFTFFAGDSIHGDEIEQVDRRVVAGFHSDARRYSQIGMFPIETWVGVDLRTDAIENALYQNQSRRRMGTMVHADVHESSLGLFGQMDVRITPWLRSVLGLRADYFDFAVDDQLEILDPTGEKSSGVRSTSALSPKASLVMGPFAKSELYLNSGYGFHSNDARGVVLAEYAVTPLAQALGYEMGIRSSIIPRMDLSTAFWALDLNSELVWVGDGGGTEARPATQRRGIDLEARTQVLPWLFADLDATFSHAVYVENAGNGDAIALAPTFALAGGLSVNHPSGFKSSMRLQHLADRPANEDATLIAQGFSVVDLSLAYRWGTMEVTLDIANLFNTEWREAQFANESRLFNEAEPQSDIHFVPGNPFTVRVGLKGKIPTRK